MECPNCNVELSRVFDRSHVEVPVGPKIQSLLVRYPLLKCPVCNEKFPTNETNEVIGKAVVEYLEREYQRTSKDLEKWHRRLRRSQLMGGTTSAAVFYSGASAFPLHKSFGCVFMALGLLFFLGYYCGPELLKMFGQKLAKRSK